MDESTFTSAQGTNGHGEKDIIYHVVIMQQGGAMGELLLPQIPEGRFYFNTDKSNVVFPLSIKAQNGEWVADADEGYYFFINNQKLDILPLRENTFHELRSSGSSYFIYTDAERGNQYTPYRVLRRGRLDIGRSADCAICCNSPTISRHHATIDCTSNVWTITDNHSTNGVYVNGYSIQHKELVPGDRIYMIGIRIIVGAGFLSINSGSIQVSVSQDIFRPLAFNMPANIIPARQNVKISYINRMPRQRALLEPKTIELESPPSPLSDRMPLLLRMGNPLLTGGRAIVTGNIFSAVTSMVMPLLTQGFTEKDRRDYEQKRQEKYREYLRLKSEEIENERRNEEQFLNAMYPAVSTTLSFTSNRERLWERQKKDDDFLSVRIGSGDIPMVATLDYPKRRFDLETDKLEEEMYALAEKRYLLKSAPVMLPLKDRFISGVTGTQQQMAYFLRNLMTQLAVTHSYDELKMVLIADADFMTGLQFVMYLPHFWSNDRSVRYVANTRSDAQHLNSALISEFEKYVGENSNKKKALKTEPAFVIFVQNPDLFDAVEVLEEIAQLDEYSGFSIVTLFDTPRKESGALIHLDARNTLVDLQEPGKENVIFAVDEYPEAYAKRQLGELLKAKLRMEDQQFALPTMLTFLDMYNIGKVEYLNPIKRWQDNNPCKSLAAPIGVGTDGKLFTLDLHEKKQGPHGLIAGGTGSGKSEFIITYILSMAVNYSPDEVAFVLIDYKGGGLADAFVDKRRGIHLPHVVGVITNLDGAAINRSLMSINSELKRRQALFSKAKSETGEGTMDIYDYQRLYRQKRVSEPLPHLFIISDEFAELKKQQPEFMDELISTARIGRSLGVHLILATQKPTGVVNDQIWSNTKFRVCLKVAEKSDSMEMLKRPEAAEIRNTGRFYLQVGYNDLFAMGQSAWCGAPYVGEEDKRADVYFGVQFLDTTGQTVLSKHVEKAKSKSDKKQIVAIVQYLSNLAKRENIVPRPLWMESLPAKLEYSTIDTPEERPGKEEISALLGRADDPSRQRQFQARLDLLKTRHVMLVGPAGSGKSTFIRTMLWSLVKEYTPEDFNYFLMDLSGGALSAFRDMPHCGGYLTEERERDFDRLLELIREITADRKKQFREAGVSGFEAYRQIGKMPLILVVIDDYQKIFSDFSKGPEIAAHIHTLLAEVSACGIKFLLSVNHSNEVSTKAKQEIDCRFALSPKDRYESGEILLAKVGFVPSTLPGRGQYLVDGEATEFHTAGLYTADTEQSALQKLKVDLDAIAEHTVGGEKVIRLPSVPQNETYQEFCRYKPNGQIPLGYSIRNQKPVLLPLQQFTCLPVYLGNNAGAKPVLRNLLYAFMRENMEITVVRRQNDSLFSAVGGIQSEFSGNLSVINCGDEEITQLAVKLNTIVTERNGLVNEYSDLAGIPRQEKGRAKRAAEYVRQRTKPIVVLFESFGDFVRLKKSDTADAVFRAFLGGLKGYNIYFAGCFYAEDQAMRSNEFVASFMKPAIAMFLGGRYSAQGLTGDLPYEYRKTDKPLPNYDNGLLLYRESWYEIYMPCGEREAQIWAPGEEPII